MMDGTRQVFFTNVLVVMDTGLVLKCRVGNSVVNVPPLRLLPGTTIRQPGDRNTLVLPLDVAKDLGLAPAPAPLEGR
jgi:hypothetical protein